MVEPLPEIEGKYEILERLQVGGMGAIYKVRHRLLGDERVVKVMRPQLVDDPELQQRFHREARAATRLIHPNIARLYDFSVDDDGAAYIVMEFIAGWTLDDLISHGELPPLGLALEIAEQGLKAIGHLHAHGVIHRDISPDNLMLTADVDGRPAVKLIDLGLIKSLATSGDLTATGVFVGKFRYASPEQFGHGGAPGPASDLYSLGLVIYELLTGRYPIVGKSASSLIAGHLFREPLDFSKTDREGRVPGDLRHAVMRALAKDPAERYPSAAAFAAALAPIRRRFELDDDATRKLLDLIRQPRPRPRLRSLSRGSTQSRFDRQFSAEPTPPPGEGTERTAAAAAEADSWARRIEAKIAVNDFAAAREELRRAIGSEGESEELWELGERIAVIEQITGAPPPGAPPPAPPSAKPPPAKPSPPPAAALASPARQVEAELVEVEALRAAGRLEKALAKARSLRERAPRHKLVKQVVIELEQEIAAAPERAAPAAAGPTAMIQSVRSQVEQELSRSADDPRVARRRADEMVAAAREHARAEDFATARNLLRRALGLWPDHPEALAMRISVETCVEVREEEERSEQELESSLRDIRDLVAAGKTESALHDLEEAARRFGERQELLELQERAQRAGEPVDDEVALVRTTPLEIPDLDDAARAVTELLPQAKAAVETPAPVYVTQPIATTGEATPAPPPPTPPPPAPPPPSPALAPPTPEPLARGFDEISLQIPQPPQAAEKAYDLDDLPLASAAEREPAPEVRSGRGELPGSPRSSRVAMVAGVVILAVFVAIGLGLSRLLSRDESDPIADEEVTAATLTASALLQGLEAPSAPLWEAAEALIADDYPATLAATEAADFADPRERAWAHLLRAAAHHALYVRGGERDARRREQAIEEIRASRATGAAVVPAEGFSPSFRDLFAKMPQP